MARTKTKKKQTRKKPPSMNAGRTVPAAATESPAQPTTYVSPVLQSRLPAISWYEFVSTGFFSGYLPKAPGTWGSLLAVLIFAITAKLLPNDGLWHIGSLAVSWWALLLGIATTAAGIYASGILAQEWREDDPGEVVIDEFAGIFFAVSLVTPDWVGLAAAFAFFRLFDVWKPGPIHSLQDMPGGYGIVLDDVLAGLAAAPCALAVQFLVQKFL
ncbi:MAG: phosphatidylglycerophosphatase A [Spirochaetota bacterium]